MQQTFQNSIDFLFYSLDLCPIEFFMARVFTRMKLPGYLNVSLPFEKKSVDNEFAPVNEVLKAVSIL